MAASSERQRAATGFHPDPPQLARTGFASEVRRIVDEAGLEPSRLVIEVTESALMDEGGVAIAALEELRVRLHRRHRRLRHGPLLTRALAPASHRPLKIDRTFLNDLTTDAEAAAYVEAIVTLGRVLNLKIVAEGVETEEQRAQLIALQCAVGQGYYFAKPMPGEDLKGDLPVWKSMSRQS